MSSFKRAQYCYFCLKKSIFLYTVALRCKSQNLSVYFCVDSPFSNLSPHHVVKISSLAWSVKNYFMSSWRHSFHVWGAIPYVLKLAHHCCALFWKCIATWRSLDLFGKCSPPNATSNCWTKAKTLSICPYKPSYERKVIFLPPSLNVSSFFALLHAW